MSKTKVKAHTRTIQTKKTIKVKEHERVPKVTVKGHYRKLNSGRKIRVKGHKRSKPN